ncbi:MAG: peptide MFS transporter [Pseudomonadota bacterium]
MISIADENTAKPPTLKEVFAGHPKGVYLIAVVEVWERFSFYGMRGLLVLFLTAAVMNGGFGWSPGQALRFYGAYISLVYVAAIVGGYLADNFIGPRRSLVIGALLMSVGHFLMAGPVAFPWLIGQIYQEPVLSVLHSQSVMPLGGLSLSAEQMIMLQGVLADAKAASGYDVSMAAASFGYLSMSYSFYAATGLIILGTGFFKPSSYALLGRLYKDTDPRRENGVFLFQIAVNFGAVTAGLVAGGIGETYGWHLGFTVAGVGMVIGTIIYMGFQNRYLGSIPHTPPAKIYKKQSTERIPLSDVEKNRLTVIALMGLISALYWLAAEQYGGLLNLYAEGKTDRMVGAFEIPATWFQSLNPFFIVALTPAAMIIWSGVGRHITPPTKFAFGFVFTAVGFFLMAGAFQEAATSVDQRSSALWLVGAYLFVTLGELCILSIGMNMVNSLAPLRMLSSVLAFWFLCTALGNYGSGVVGAMTETLPDIVIFLGIAAACLAAAAVLFVGARWWSRFVHADEARTQ